MIGEDQGVKGPWSSGLMSELLLIAAYAPAGLLVLHLLNRRLSDAHDQTAKQTQNQCRIGVAHSAAILVQRNVQRMVQTALNDPVAALEFEPAQGSEFFQSQAANQINRFGGLLAPTAHSPFESGDQPCAGKAHLLGCHFPAMQNPNLAPPPVAFAGQGVGLRSRLRGKICPAAKGWPGFEGV